MKPGGPMKLVSELLDLPLFDSDGRYCGIVDDLEFSGGPGQELKLKALLVGPGAYARRLPRWAVWLVGKIAGTSLVRVPIAEIGSIGPEVKLRCAARDLGLDKSEAAAARMIPHRGAL